MRIHSRKAKYIFLRFVLLLIILGIGGFFFFNHFKKAQAEWFDSNWFYRKAINIANTGTSQTDYQVSITLDTATLYTAGKIQIDCDDIRITDINGKLLPHWIETGTNSCNTATTAIWTKVPSIPTSGQTVYLYYGNPNAANVQNGNNVFLFFDDFNTSTLSNYSQEFWADHGGASSATDWQIAGGEILGGDVNNMCGIIYSNTSLGSANIYVKTEAFSSDDDGYGIYLRNSAGDNRVSYLSNNHLAPGMHAQYTSGDSYNTIGSFTDGTRSQVAYQTLALSSVSNVVNVWKDGVKILNNQADTFTIDRVGLATLGNQPGSHFKYLLAAKYAATPPTNSAGTEEKGTAPIAYWKFDEGQGSTTYDESSNNNDGTISGSTWQAEDMCVTGKCLKFDGSNDYVSVANANSINFDRTQPFTISLWLKPNSTPTDWKSILTKLNEAVGAKGIRLLFGSSRTLYFLFTDNHTVNDTYLITSSALTLNNWYHFVVTYDGNGNTNGMALYLNGKLDVSGGGGNLSTTTQNTYLLTIGASSNNGRFFDGSIDDVKIYPYARSADQIKADYNAGKSGAGGSAKSASMGNKTQDWMSNGLVGYWKMDESSWGSVLDSSGNGYNGTKAGDATVGSGKFGNGGVFDGTGDYVGVTHNQGNNIKTVSAWFKLNSMPTGAPGGIVLANASSTSGPASFDKLLRVTTAGKIEYYFYDSGNGRNATGTTTLTTGVWYHAVAVTNSNNTTVYLNGVQEGSYNSVSTNSGNYMIIDFDDTTYGSYAQDISGSIDEVRIYNRALSPKEISDLYNWAPGPLLYWKMDDHTGTTTIDSSGNGYTGTLATGATWKNGKYGSGIGLGGTSGYVATSGNPSALDLTTAATWGGWFNRTGYSNGCYDGVMGHYNTQIDEPGTCTGVHYSTIYCTVLGSDGNWKGTGQYDIGYNQWHHVMCTFDSSLSSKQLQLWVDGVQRATYDWAGTIQSQSSYNYVFGSQGGANANFQGIGDDIKVYNYARTQKQILEDMNAGHPAVGSPVGSYVGYWKFDEGYGTTAYDSSINDNDGTITNASWTNNGKFGKALNFDASGEHVRKASTIFDRTNGQEISVSAWIKPNWTSGYGDIVVNRTASLYNWMLYQHATDGSIQFHGAAQNKSTYIPPNNTWTHIVATVDASGNYKLYANGVLKQSVAGYQYYSSAPGTLSIGDFGSNSEPWNGTIDELKIYQFALTADDVKTEYNQGKSIVMGSLSNTSGLTGGSVASNSASAAYCIPGDTATCSPPVGEWKMDEKSGNYAQDTSGNNNMGTLGGGTSGYMPTWQRASMCHNGACLKFDGTDDYIDAGSGLTLSAPYTVEGWVQVPANPGSNNRFMIDFSSSAGSLPAFSPNFWTSNKPLIYLNSNNYKYGSSNLADNRWHHVVFTVTGSSQNDIDNAKIYVDGKEETYSSTTKSSAPNTPTGKVHIGTGAFNGFLDDIKVFNYIRTPAQIAWDYNRGKPVGYWNFDECQGSTVNDLSGNGNTGTITIGATAPQTTLGTCTAPVDGTGAWYNGRSGRFNSALSFDGVDDYVNASNVNFGFNNATQISVDLWINSNSADGRIINKQISDGWNTFTLIFTSQGILSWSVQNSALLQYPTWRNSSAISSGWHHIVATFKKNNINATDGAIYVDGVSVATTYIANSYASNFVVQETSNNLYFGIRPITFTYPLNGSMDDVKIYNYALTAEQIKLDYNQGSAVRFAPITGRP